MADVLSECGEWVVQLHNNTGHLGGKIQGDSTPAEETELAGLAAFSSTKQPPSSIVTWSPAAGPLGGRGILTAESEDVYQSVTWPAPSGGGNSKADAWEDPGGLRGSKDYKLKK